MQARFLLGPAGSGKTFRCLAEIRAELQASADGPPLVLLAPKQATYQLERQLMADVSLRGYTRLHILSFERLAGFVFDHLRRPRPQLLGEEGRVMVLRALLGRMQDQLRVFHASARLPGLAQQLSLLLRELQRHHLSVAGLQELAGKVTASTRLPDKLHDLGLVLRAYLDWLQAHQLQDADCLLDLATEALQSAIRNPQSAIHFGRVWLDGFAEMTPQELDLLTAVVSCSERATLAFCLEARLQKDPAWLSTWSVVGQTFRRCYERFASLPDCAVTDELLPREAISTRFIHPVLRHLEAHWTDPQPFRIAAAGSTQGGTENAQGLHGGEFGVPPEGGTTNAEGAGPAVDDTLSVFVCANPQGEAEMAAREILRYVREDAGRFRDCAVILRQWEGYHAVLRRVFRRYEIPFFMDRREPVAHHPAAELTRYALRTMAYGWQTEDWFGALKTGLVPASEPQIDELENAALAHGWKGPAWLRPLPLSDEPAWKQAQIETLRARLVPPFQQLHDQLAAVNQQPTGAELADMIRKLWLDLNIGGQLEAWSISHLSPRTSDLAPHSTVWDQLNAWLDNLALAFCDEPMPLRDWLPVLESGLAGLTAGAIPPALDQVLIGTIDRSRNPDLQLALVLGLNESVFPALPPAPSLLSESDREELERNGVALGPNWRARLGHERYLGYIAFTRPRRRLVASLSRLDADDRALNPSPFVEHLKRLFPGLEPKPWTPPEDWLSSVHPNELAPSLLRALRTDSRRAGEEGGGSPWADDRFSSSGGEGRGEGERLQAVRAGDLTALLDLTGFPALARVCERLASLAAYAPDDQLSPVLARQLYTEVLSTSVSAVEKFAACPFQFFIHAGLRAEERKVFEVDQRERGSFQHEVLARFHQRACAWRGKWRGLTPAEARDLVGRVAEEVIKDYNLGLFQADPQSRFAARALTGALQDFIEVAVGWLSSNQFDPTAVEVGFGFKDSRLPAWEIDLGRGCRMAFRGKIDRVDLAPDPDSGGALCVVLDYKSGQRKIDPLFLEHGIQIQLPAYLAALCQMSHPSDVLGVSRLDPAGMFYVNLRGSYESGTSRSDVLADPATVRRQAYKHSGRFSLHALPRLDTQSRQEGSGQFSYAIKRDGSPNRTYKDLVSQSEFNALLARVHASLKEMGQRIFAGAAAVDPYRHRSDTACDRCQCQSICRIDPWTHPYRALKKGASANPALTPPEAPPCA